MDWESIPVFSLNKQAAGISNYPLKKGGYLNRNEFTASNLERLKIVIVWKNFFLERERRLKLPKSLKF